MPHWLLPENISDVLPREARRVEQCVAALLDLYRGYGYELVIPPLIEHADSLLTGTGSDLDLRTFKLTDQSSGRLLGLRADTTPQVARIDAHILNRQGVVAAVLRRQCPARAAAASACCARADAGRRRAVWRSAASRPILKCWSSRWRRCDLAGLPKRATGSWAHRRCARHSSTWLDCRTRLVDDMLAALSAKDVPALRKQSRGAVERSTRGIAGAGAPGRWPRSTDRCARASFPSRHADRRGARWAREHRGALRRR